MNWNKEIISWIGSAIISIVLINLGLLILGEKRYFGIITILIALVFLYITYYANQIRTNTQEIKELKEQSQKEREILNTMKDIIILKKVSKIK